MLYWLYTKRVYLWLICLLTIIFFGVVVHFFEDWVNKPGNEAAIIFLISLWIFSILTFYVNAIAVTAYGKMASRLRQTGKGIIVALVTLVTAMCCAIAIKVLLVTAS